LDQKAPLGQQFAQANRDNGFTRVTLGRGDEKAAKGSITFD
jgi:hypothetical protein